MVDKIVVLNDGNIAYYGAYEELISRGGVSAQFLKSYLDQDAESEQEDDEGRPQNLVQLVWKQRKHLIKQSDTVLYIPQKCV